MKSRTTLNCSIFKSIGVATAPLNLHPYLYLLYTNLMRHGIGIYDKLRPLNTFKIMIHRKEIQFIHLHWIEIYFITNNFILTTVLGFMFISWLIFLKLVLRLKIVITLHNVVPHEHLATRIEHTVFATSLKLANALIVHNFYAKNAAEQLYDADISKIYVIPHGNFLSYYRNDVSKEQARKYLGIPQDKIVLLFFGQIRTYKGITHLLTAFEKVTKKNPNLFLLIAGSCQDATLEHRLISFQKRHHGRSLQILKYIPSDRVQLFMNAADIGVLPYRETTTPGSLLLFMSFGKPVIIPNLIPILEIVKDDHYCILYNKYGTNSLEEAILRAAKKGRFDKMSRSAFENAKLYDWRNSAYKTLLVYNSVFRN